MVRGCPGLLDIDFTNLPHCDDDDNSPASLWAGGYVEAGVSSVFRYEYGKTFIFLKLSFLTRMVFVGPVFPDLQVFPMAGAWHSTEREFQLFKSQFMTPMLNAT
jgi:hypothetical protein